MPSPSRELNRASTLPSGIIYEPMVNMDLAVLAHQALHFCIGKNNPSFQDVKDLLQQTDQTASYMEIVSAMTLREFGRLRSRCQSEDKCSLPAEIIRWTNQESLSATDVPDDRDILRLLQHSYDHWQDVIDDQMIKRGDEKTTYGRQPKDLKYALHIVESNNFPSVKQLQEFYLHRVVGAVIRALRYQDSSILHNLASLAGILRMIDEGRLTDEVIADHLAKQNANAKPSQASQTASTPIKVEPNPQLAPVPPNAEITSPTPKAAIPAPTPVAFPRSSATSVEVKPASVPPETQTHRYQEITSLEHLLSIIQSETRGGRAVLVQMDQRTLTDLMEKILQNRLKKYPVTALINRARSTAQIKEGTANGTMEVNITGALNLNISIDFTMKNGANNEAIIDNLNVSPSSIRFLFKTIDLHKEVDKALKDGSLGDIAAKHLSTLLNPDGKRPTYKNIGCKISLGSDRLLAEIKATTN